MRIFFALLLLSVVGAFGAQPSFNDFNSGQFSGAGRKVTFTDGNNITNNGGGTNGPWTMKSGTSANATDPRNNDIFFWGFNHTPSGARADTSQAQFSFALETYFQQVSPAARQQEYYVTYRAPGVGNADYRPWNLITRSNYSQITWDVYETHWDSWSGTNDQYFYIQDDSPNHGGLLEGRGTIRLRTNNTATANFETYGGVFSAKNAAGTLAFTMQTVGSEYQISDVVPSHPLHLFGFSAVGIDNIQSNRNNVFVSGQVQTDDGLGNKVIFLGNDPVTPSIFSMETSLTLRVALGGGMGAKFNGTDFSPDTAGETMGFGSFQWGATKATSFNAAGSANNPGSLALQDTNGIISEIRSVHQSTSNNTVVLPTNALQGILLTVNKSASTNQLVALSSTTAGQVPVFKSDGTVTVSNWPSGGASGSFIPDQNGVGTNTTFWGSSGATNKTFTDQFGWHNTNLTTGGHVDTASGNIGMSGALTAGNATANTMAAFDAAKGLTNIPAGSAGQALFQTASGFSWSNITAAFPLTADGNAAAFSITNLSKMSIGPGPADSGAQSPFLTWHSTNSAGNPTAFRMYPSNALMRLDGGTVGAGYVNIFTASTGVLFTVNGAITAGNNGGITAGGNLISGGVVQAAQASDFDWSGRSRLKSSADGLIELLNNGSSSFTRLNFGGATATFPAWTVTAAGFTLTGGDGTSNNTNNLIIPGSIKVGPSGSAVTNILTGSATLDFASSGLDAIQDLAITVTGAASGDVVSVGVPQASITGITGTFSGFASNNTVFVRFSSQAVAQDPASGTFRVLVTKF